MFDLDSWQEVWQTIARNKMRSTMTAFGVFWGIFMLVVMIGAGNGLGNGMSAGVMAFSSNSLFMFTNRTSVPYKGFKKGRYWEMKNEDLSILKRQIPEIKYISSMVFGNRNDNNVVKGDKYGTFNVMGYSPDYNKIDPQQLIYGRFLNDIDIREKRKVCVIGQRVYNDLYKPGEDPTGTLLKINGVYYTVVGQSTPLTKNINIEGDPSDRIAVPVSTLQQASQLGDVIHSIAITAADDTPVSDMEEQIKEIVKMRHQIAPEDPQALNSINVEKIFKTFQNLWVGIGVLIWIVGTGTLLAGVVGVSNIMLVTVRERTQEIGVRRALGAKPYQIILQIMCESMVLTSIAGLVGITVGVGLLAAVDSVLSANPSEDTFFTHPQIAFGTALLAVAVLIVSGMIAGLLPSYRALQIKAIDALRDE